MVCSSIGRVRAPAALVLLCFAACGGSEPPARAPRVVLAVDLQRQAAGPPDGGLDQGHGADGAFGSATGSSFRFTGRVKPGGARVRVTDPRSRVRTRIGRLGPGRFVVRLEGLAAGVNRLRLSASREGYAPRTLDLRIVRG